MNPNELLNRIDELNQMLMKATEEKIKLLEKIIFLYETRPYFMEAEDIMKKYMQDAK
jgi:hypothetical protein